MKHDFRAWDLVIYMTAWKCKNCGMKAPSYSTARRLDGKPCYG